MWVQDQASLPAWPQNRARTPVDGTVEAFDASGHFVGDAKFTLDPGARLVKLLLNNSGDVRPTSRGFPGALPGWCGRLFCLFGNLAGDWISTIPGE